MKLSIMQPYIFPYIGYFHLIEATDKIVFYDDVNYIKRGWINRNRILLNKSDFLFTIPVEKASQNKLINEIRPLITYDFTDKFFAQIETAYKKAPYYKSVVEILKAVFSVQHDNIADLAIKSITSVYQYLDMDIKWTKSSISSPETKGMEKADRLIQINKNLGYYNYVNAIGGQELYSKEYFNSKGIKLNFVKSQKVEYKQFDNDFVPWLSIIDVLMFNDKKAMKEQFTAHNIV
ncbi:WbqC-like protein family protein [Psychroflexus salarius]|uniref:WbqC-like protein family protein n=1 Tax=Psychroflexus salarius TaxID=1155689 RepID=A0A1M4YCG4_9FLAO|nr:WbqC family protein [Psychroflexus salarius]SHF03236.1 WbqC-like protein family protein [Psychroflexus salarius]